VAINPYDDTLEQLDEGADQAPANPYADTLQLEDGGRETELRTVLSGAAKISPDAAAEAQQLAARTGLPAGVVERNLEDIRRRAKVADTPYARMLRETPALADWMATPANAAIAHDDLEQLGRVERTLRFGENAIRSLGTGPMALSRGVWDLVRAGGEWAGSETVAEFAKGSAAIAQHLEQRIRGDRGGRELGFLERSIYGGIESASLSLSALPTLFLPGGQGIFLGTLGGVTAGHSYAEARDKGLSVGHASAFGIGQGAIEAATELIPAKWFLDDLAKNAPAWKLIRNNLLAEIPGEQVATATQDLNEWANLHPDKPFLAYLQERPSRAAETLISTIVAAGGQGAVVKAIERVAGKPTSQQVIEELGAAVTDSKTGQRSPDALEGLLQAATKDGPLSHVYAPIETFTEYFQSKGEDPAAIAEQLTGDPQAFARAQASGADLQIPTARYAARLAGTEHNSFFAQELRLDPEQPNARELAALEKEVGEASAAATAEGSEDPAAAVRADVARQLEAAGYERSAAEASAAALSGFGSIAERLGEESALELFSGYDVRVQRAGLEAASQAAPAAPSIPPSRGRQGETSTQYRARRTGHLTALASALVKDAQQLDPNVDPAAIRAELDFRLQRHEEEASFEATESGRGQDLLRAIAGYGGIWWESRTGALKGEIEHLNESGRDIAGVARSGKVKHIRGRATWNGVPGVFNPEGRTPDDVTRLLMQDPRFAYLEDDLNNLLVAIDKAIRAKRDDAFLPGTDELEDLGITLGTAWWQRPTRPEAWQPADDVVDEQALEQLEASDAIEPEDGDDSFDVTEFNQGLVEEVAESAGRMMALLEQRGVEPGEIISITFPKPRVVDDVQVEQELPDAGAVADLAGELQQRLEAVPTSRRRVSVSSDTVLNQGPAPATLAEERLADLLAANANPDSKIVPLPIINPALSERLWQATDRTQAERRTVSIAQLVATQQTVSAAIVREKLEDAGDALPIAMEHEGRFYLADGTHRAVAAWARGDTSIAVMVSPVKSEWLEQPPPHRVFLDAAARRSPAPATESIQDDAGRELLGPGGFVGPGVTRFNQGEAGGTRGSIRFGKDRKFTIELGARADLSTFLHETGHLYLEVLGDVADRLADAGELTGTREQLAADYRTILAWLGVENRAAIGVDQHEQFARGFEAYLMEGKAPSAELRSAFARFRAWLTGIYRTLRNLNVDLSDDVRRVFDRLLATDAAIAAAEAEGSVTPLFTDATSAGMTELDFAQYLDQVREASARQQEELQARILSELKREEFSWYQTERDRIRAEVEAEVNARPIYRALSVMRTGAYPDGSPLVEGEAPVPMKLSRDSLVAQFGRDILAKLPRPYIYAKDSGISADTAAELFGFSSGDAFKEALVASRPARQVIDEEVEARMFAKHGDVMRDGRLEDLARAAVNGEHRQTVVQAELKALTRGMVRATIPPAAAINAAAAARIAQTRIRDIRPGIFLQASRQAARRAFELLASGNDRAGAVRAKQQELVNLALYREARDAKERVESMRRTLQAYGSTAARQRFGKAGADYLEQIDGLLERYELARVTQTDLERRSSLAAFVDKLKAEDMPVDIPASLLNDSRRVNYQDATLDELTGVYEAVEHIAHLARLKNELLKAAKKRDFEAARDTLVGSIRLENDAKPLPLEFRPADAKVRNIQNWIASHKKIAMLARALDGHDSGGEVWEQIIRPINEAANAKETRNAEAGKVLAGLMEAAYPGRELATLNDQKFIPALNASLSKEAALAVALNWGNEGNRSRVLNDPTRKWSPAQVEAILATLDARDWRFVQGAWDFVDSFWPDIAAKQKRVTGLEPEKVDALPFTVRTRDGDTMTTLELRGGYYPLQYDGRLVARASAFEKGGEATLAAAAGYVKATTRRGHTEARQQNVKMSVRLELSVLFNHVDQVIHDLTHHEMLIDVSRLLGDPDVQAAILETKGDHVYAQFTAALKDIAAGREPGPGNIVEKAANFMRTRTQIAMMGYSFWTAVQQPLGLFNGAARIGPRALLRGLLRWTRDAATMENTVAFVHGKSEAMRNRHLTATQDLADLQQALKQPGGWFDNLLRTTTFDKVTQADLLNSYLWHIGLAQKVADVPTWLGEYEKQLELNPEDEARAVALADQAVIDSQGSGQVKDLAQVQRGGPVAKLFLTFYSYGNTLYNSTADVVGAADWRKPRSVGTALGQLSLLYIGPAAATIALRSLFGNDDEDEGFFEAVGYEVLATALNTMVLAREFSGLLGDGVRGYAGPAGARFIQTIYSLAGQIKQGDADEAALKAANQALGVIFRYPALQVQRTTDGAVALWEGRTRNPFALLVGGPKE
jgi:hypothetical protein